MNNKSLLALTSAISLTWLGLSLPSAAAEPVFTRYQLGLEIQNRHSHFVPSRGGELFKSHVMQRNIYGAFWGDYFGGEVGFQGIYRNTGERDSSHLTGQKLLDVTLATTETHHSQMKIDGWYAAVLAKHRLRWDNLLVRGGIGFSHLSFRLDDNRLSPTHTKRRFSKNRLVPRLDLGLELLLNKNLGIRLNYVWENSKRYQIFVNSAFVQPKNHSTQSLGIFYYF